MSFGFLVGGLGICGLLLSGFGLEPPFSRVYC